MSKVASKVIMPEGVDSPVILACFNAGFPIMATPQQQIDFKLYSNAENRKEKQRMLVGENAKLTFVGKNFSETAGLNSNCKYVIGIHNKKKEKIQLVEVPQLFCLQQHLKHSNIPDPVSEPEGVRADNATQRRELTNTFGSRKSKSQLRAADSNKIDVKDISQVDGVAKRIGDAAEADTVDPNDVDLTATVPPHDALATVPEKAYPLGKVFEDDLWEALNPKMYKGATKDPLKRAGLDGGNSIPKYVLDRLSRMGNINGEELDTKCRCLMFITLLFRFNQLGKFIKKLPTELASELGCAFSIAQAFLTLFATLEEGKTYKKTKLQNDLLVNYIAVLCLHVDNFQTTTEPLATDLKIGGKKMSVHFRAIGCQVGRLLKRKADELGDAGGDADSNLVTLPVPLKFPLPHRGPAKK